MAGGYDLSDRNINKGMKMSLKELFAKVLPSTKYKGNRFEFGDQVRDKITGIEGTVTMRTTFINGCVQYAIYQKGDPSSKMKDLARSLDRQSLELVPGSTRMDIAQDAVTPQKEFAFGAKVRCMLTGVEGTVTSKSEQFNGAVDYGVQPKPKADDPNSYPENVYLYSNTMEELPEEPAKVKPIGTGGPARASDMPRSRSS